MAATTDRMKGLAVILLLITLLAHQASGIQMYVCTYLYRSMHVHAPMYVFIVTYVRNTYFKVKSLSTPIFIVTDTNISFIQYTGNVGLLYTVDPPDGSVITGFEGQQHFEITCQITYDGPFPFPVETEWRLLTADVMEEGSGGLGPVVIDAENDERFSFEDEGNSKLIIDILAPELNQSEIFCHETYTELQELVASFTLMTTREYPMNVICACFQMLRKHCMV